MDGQNHYRLIWKYKCNTNFGEDAYKTFVSLYL